MRYSRHTEIFIPLDLYPKKYAFKNAIYPPVRKSVELAVQWHIF